MSRDRRGPHLAERAHLRAARSVVRWLEPALVNTPRVWGDRSRVHVHPDAGVADAMFNTSSGDITVERYAFFGHGVMLITGTHDATLEGLERMLAYPRSGRDIVVREGAWIGTGAIVLGGVTVGRNAVVAAGAVVTKDVPDDHVALGIPARVRPRAAAAPGSA